MYTPAWGKEWWLMEEESISIDFGHGLNLKRAEDAVSRLGADRAADRKVVLDLSQCAHIDMGAGWRVGCALRRFKPQGSIEAIVPDPGDFGGRWFLHFTRSGLGHAIARYASRVTYQAEDITERLRRYYRNPRRQPSLPQEGVPPGWISKNFVLIPDIDRGLLPLDNIAPFRLTINPLLDFVNIDEQAYNRADIAALFRLLFESAQNVWDHADRPPLPRSTQVLSYLSLRYYRNISVPREAKSQFEGYLTRYPRQLPDSADVVGIAEMVVVDDGVGIAARQERTLDIYWGPLELERKALLHALSDGISVKLTSQDATVRGQPGFGFANMKDALKHLNSFCLLRTGRHVAYFDSTIEFDGFEILGNPLGYMPGTVLQIILPLRKRRVWDD